MRFVEMVWMDPNSHSRWSKPEDCKPCKCTTRGWLVHEGVDYYVLAATMQEGEGDWGEIIAIPAGCLVTLEDFGGGL